jgi:hypothetical protein
MNIWREIAASDMPKMQWPVCIGPSNADEDMFGLFHRCWATAVINGNYLTDARLKQDMAIIDVITAR